MVASEPKPLGYLNFFTIPLILIGVFSFCTLCYSFYEVQASKKWKTAEANVQSVDLKTHFRKHRNRYTVLVKYDYMVEGQHYIGDRIMFPHSVKFIKNGNYYDRLNHAKIIQIYYNPKDPSDAVIINTLTNEWFSLAYFVVFWNSILLGFFCFSKKKNKSFFLIPLTILILGIIWRVSDIGVKTDQLIKVIEGYPPDHCKFKMPFKDYAYMFINNVRMEADSPNFDKESKITNIDIIEKEMLKDSVLYSIAKVNYDYRGAKDSMFFELRFQVFDKCNYKLLALDILD